MWLGLRWGSEWFLYFEETSSVLSRFERCFVSLLRGELRSFGVGGVAKRANLATLLKDPITRDVSPLVRGRSFHLLKLSCMCLYFSMGRRALPTTITKLGAYNVHNFGLAVPGGGGVMGLLSRLSPRTRLVNTIGAMLGSGKGLVKCGASKCNFVRSMHSTKRSVANGGVAIVKMKKTSVTVYTRSTLSNTTSMRVFTHHADEC